MAKTWATKCCSGTYKNNYQLCCGIKVFNKGPFGGVRYTPSFCKELKLMVEYDTRGWNMGAAMRFWKHLSVNVFTREFTCVSAGLRYECTLMH